jgi:hypothetical protein
MSHGFWKRRVALAARHTLADHLAFSPVLASLTAVPSENMKAPRDAGLFADLDMR